MGAPHRSRNIQMMHGLRLCNRRIVKCPDPSDLVQQVTAGEFKTAIVTDGVDVIVKLAAPAI